MISENLTLREREPLNGCSPALYVDAAQQRNIKYGETDVLGAQSIPASNTEMFFGKTSPPVV